jgi:DNA-damage-inducible protein J
MAQTNLTIRIDENLKHQAEALFEKVGLTMSAAINVFFRQAVRDQAIPFQIKAKSNEDTYGEYMNEHALGLLMESVAKYKAVQTNPTTNAGLETMEDSNNPHQVMGFDYAGDKKQHIDAFLKFAAQNRVLEKGFKFSRDECYDR